MKAMFMLAGANIARHQDLRTHLENSYTIGRNEYPANTTELLSMMNNWKSKDHGRGHYNYIQTRLTEDDGLNFVQEGGTSDKGDTENKGVSMIQAKQGKQKGILKNPIGENTPHGKKDDKSACIRCGGSHSLWECPEITDEQLGELLN